MSGVNTTTTGFNTFSSVRPQGYRSVKELMDCSSPCELRYDDTDDAELCLHGAEEPTTFVEVQK